MNSKTYYLIIFLVLITAVVLVVVFSGEEPPAAESSLPPGHPDISQMEGEGAPGKSNVRAEFLHQLEQMQKKVDAQPESDTTGVLALARLLFESHKQKESIAYFERYVRVAPDNIDAKIDLSVVYFEQKQLDNAMNITKDVLKRQPGNTIAHYNLGVLYLAMEKKDEAKQQLEDLIKNYPESADAKRAEELLKQI